MYAVGFGQELEDKTTQKLIQITVIKINHKQRFILDAPPTLQTTMNGNFIKMEKSQKIRSIHSTQSSLQHYRSNTVKVSSDTLTAFTCINYLDSATKIQKPSGSAVAIVLFT